LFWRTKKGEIVRICDMQDSHLTNAINKLCSFNLTKGSRAQERKEALFALKEEAASRNLPLSFKYAPEQQSSGELQQTLQKAQKAALPDRSMLSWAEIKNPQQSKKSRIAEQQHNFKDSKRKIKL
jgi:hypothetical protein